MKQLEGKVAIVTGGGSGIGKGIAQALARQGVRVVVCGRRKDKVEEAVEQIWSDGDGAIAVVADVSQPDEVDHLIKTALETYRQIDILVNNAGVGGGGPIHSHDAAVWNRVMDVNLGGAFLMTRAVLPHMRNQGSGHIINISSESGLEYYPGNGAYGVSKHALNALGEYVQRENQDFNIRVNAICPGMVVSEMTENTPGLDHEKCLYPEDIAELVIWLLTRRQNIKIGTPILIQTMLNPWE
ncbi:MAG TPA: SDR family oxidoreductase [Anaerolineales bacterium]|nr:SDR family oxidoreductase [Anaerolineales bacterium]